LGYPARKQGHAVAVFCVDAPFECGGTLETARRQWFQPVSSINWANLKFGKKFGKSDQPDRSGSICRRQDERGKIR
jgi:hypothetical protein